MGPVGGVVSIVLLAPRAAVGTDASERSERVEGGYHYRPM
jgi:hypothetical protein